jgi:hypothetical protein
VFLSGVQRQKGWLERARSYSANLAVGDGNAESGPWDPIYRHVRKGTGFIITGRAETFVFVDEHSDY